MSTGTSYYVRAINDVPHQNIYSAKNYNYQLSLPFSAAPEDVKPNPPATVALSLLSGTSLRVILVAPSRTGGPAITHYQVETMFKARLIRTMEPHHLQRMLLLARGQALAAHHCYMTLRD